MKKILFISIFFIISNRSHSQNLEYSRVIDTTLSITIPASTIFNISNRLIIGNYITSPPNKVWKVQSVIIMPVPAYDINGNSILLYQSGNNWGSFNSLSARISLMIKNNTLEEELFSESIPGQGTYNLGSNRISSPLWINNSELGIAFKHNYNQPINPNNPYLNPNWGSYTGYIHLSIIEFNE
tara:strand:+ start:934 stop:1482 length:549 start_codon:yes stop_codon:yes gene_type:complete